MELYLYVLITVPLKSTHSDKLCSVWLTFIVPQAFCAETLLIVLTLMGGANLLQTE